MARVDNSGMLYVGSPKGLTRTFSISKSRSHSMDDNDILGEAALWPISRSELYACRLITEPRSSLAWL